MEADELANWLLEQDSSVALQWLHEMLEGLRPIPDGFPWVGLAECAAFDTFHKTLHHSGSLSQPDLGWATVSVLAYRYAIHREKQSSRLAHKPLTKKLSYLSLERTLMNIQARCILAYGSVEGDAVLDVNQLIACFLEDIPYSPEEIRQRFVGERQPPTSEEYRELLRIHMKLQILRLLQEKEMMPPYPDVLAWISVWEQTHQYWKSPIVRRAKEKLEE